MPTRCPRKHRACSPECEQTGVKTKRYNFLAAVFGALLTHAPCGWGEITSTLPVTLAQPASAQGRIIVQTNAGISDQEFGETIDFYAVQSRKKIAPTGLHVIQVSPGEEQAILQELAVDPAVAFAESDQIVAPAYVPDDTHYASAWHLQTLQLPVAWDSSQGANITVAVLDTGINATHEDLAGRLAVGWNAVDGDAVDYSDIHGHGTAIAGVIGAATNNGIGVASIAPAATILPIRITNRADGVAFTSDMAAALIWAADQGARVANISYDITPSMTVGNAAQYFRSKGGVVVVAAGNQNGDPGHTDSPFLVSVSGTTSADNLAGWSNFGSYIDVAAPGQGIWTTNRNGGYSSLSGTSFASPAVAAVAALVMSVDRTLTPDEVETIIEATADDLGTPGVDTRYGHGRINAAAAVARATQGSAVDIIAPVVTAPPDITVEATGPLTAVISGSAVALDAVDGALTASMNPTGPFAVGIHVVTWSASDTSGNTGTDTQVITVDDTTPPLVTAPPDLTIQSVGGSVAVQLGMASAADLVDGELTVTPDQSGSFDVGIHTVVWSATDSSGNTGSATQQVTVSLADVTPPQVTPPPDLVVEASGTLTAATLGTATAVDNVDGVLVPSPDQTGPFAVGVHVVRWRVNDVAGNIGVGTQTVSVVDTTPPVISVPPDVVVNASGYQTAVATGAASATDTVTAEPVITVDEDGPFVSGRHTLTWTARDAAGNTAGATQQLTVMPLLNMAPEQIVGEGGEVSVRVHLSGEAPVYPVTVPYSVSGTALNPGDHDAASGVIQIASGVTGVTTFRVVDDGVSGEPEEHVLFTLGSPANAVPGSRTVHRVSILEGNVAPRAALEVRQAGKTARIVYADSGLVTISAVVKDPNPGDVHNFDWALSDNTLTPVSGYSNPDFVFDPALLGPGIYTLQLAVTDNGVPQESVEVLMSLRVAASAPALSAQIDSDSDGVSDAAEGSADGDLDGIPDYLDAVSDPAVLQSQTSAGFRDMLATDAGLQLRLGDTALAAGRNGARIALHDVISFGGQNGAAGLLAADALTYAGGVFDFEITGLSVFGQSVAVVLPQAAPIPAQAVYRKYAPDQGWQDFIVDIRNTVMSMRGSDGVCPAAGDTGYVDGLRAGYQCVQLIIEDGGPNDTDGKRNGTVRDPGGVGKIPAATGTDSNGGNATDTGGGGGGGCTFSAVPARDGSWLLIIAGLLILGYKTVRGAYASVPASGCCDQSRDP